MTCSEPKCNQPRVHKLPYCEEHLRAEIARFLMEEEYLESRRSAYEKVED